LEQWRQATGAYPDDYYIEPLPAWLAPVYAAWQALTGSRQWTMGGAGSIPVSEIIVYLGWQQVEGDEAAEWMYLLQQLDAEYLAEVNKQNEK